MNKQWFGVERMLLLSFCFTLFLLASRILYFGQLQFLFYVWNLVLAAIPLLLSRRLIKFKRLKVKALLLLICWLLFLPNAPYVITDILHFYERPPVPKWFDLLLIVSAAWSGLITGIISLLQVDQFLSRFFLVVKVRVLMGAAIISCAFGIYIGRFMRFNSWDVATRPGVVFHDIAARLLEPSAHPRTWAFTVLITAMLWLVYQTIRKLSVNDPFLIKVSIIDNSITSQKK